MADWINTKTIFAAHDAKGAVAEAALLIRRGDIVVLPTETVYGLAADALNENAVQKIFEAKGRPQDNPLIVHISDADMLNRVARDVPECAKKLMKNFWPGPLSLVMKKSENIPDIVSAGLSTVAVRMPNSDIMQAVIRAAGVPLAAPSANTSGRPSPTLARHAFEDLCGRVPLIVDGGPCTVGVESTVVDLTGDLPLVLRPGNITPKMIEDVCGSVALHPSLQGARVDIAASPGMKYRHYAPKARVSVFTGDKKTVANTVNTMYDIDKAKGLKPVIFCADHCANFYAKKNIRPLGTDRESIQASLFGEMRRADEHGSDHILFHYTDDMGLAVKNRIEKAAQNVATEEPKQI